MATIDHYQGDEMNHMQLPQGPPLMCCITNNVYNLFEI